MPSDDSGIEGIGMPSNGSGGQQRAHARSGFATQAEVPQSKGTGAPASTAATVGLPAATEVLSRGCPPPHDALDRRSGTNCLLVVRARATCRAIQKKTVASDARGLSAAAGIPQVSSAEPSSTPMKYPTRLAVVHSHSLPTHGTSRYSIPMYSDR